mgnify:CR=1 FL=1
MINQNKSFMKRWIEGMQNLTPAQMLHIKMNSQIGMIIGMVLAGVFLAMQGFWYMDIIMLFAIIIQVVDYIGTRQQWIQICKLMDVESDKRADEKFEELQKKIPEELL